MLGGSRWQEARANSLSGSRTFFNAHVHNDYTEDALALVELLDEAGRRPPCQDQAGQLVAPLELAGPAHQRAHAVGRGRDAEPAQAGLVASADEHDHRLPPGQVDAGDERVRGDQLSTALQLGGPAAHASGYLHVEPLLFGVDQFRILEGLTDDRNAGARTRAVEMPGCGQARIGLAATRGFGAGLTTALGQPHGVAHIPTAPAAADFNLIRRLRRAISAMRT